MATDTKNKPVADFRIGAVKAAVWEQKTDKGVFYNVTIERGYKDDADQWQSSNSFSVSDLPAVNIVTRQAQRWIETKLVEG